MRRSLRICYALYCTLLVGVAADAERRPGYRSNVTNLRGTPVLLSPLLNGEPGYYIRNAGVEKVTGIRWACVSTNFVPRLIFENEDLDKENIPPKQSKEMRGLTGEEHSCNVLEGKVAITEVEFSTGTHWRKHQKQYVPKPKRRPQPSKASDGTVVFH